MLRRECNGLKLTFRLAGINNQNFLMRDEETGTYWQQISGMAVSGPLMGKHLEIIRADELTFKLWKAEQPHGTVLADDAKFTSQYAKKDWDVKMKKAPTVLSYAEAGVQPRDLMLGVAAFGAARAFPYEAVVKAKLIQDRVGSEPVLLLVGPDHESVRVFRRKIEGTQETPDFYTLADGSDVLDSINGDHWDFKGCSTKSVCLEPVIVVKDYWFDWRHYHPDTTIYGITRR